MIVSKNILWENGIINIRDGYLAQGSSFSLNASLSLFLVLTYPKRNIFESTHGETATNHEIDCLGSEEYTSYQACKAMCSQYNGGWWSRTRFAASHYDDVAQSVYNRT